MSKAIAVLGSALFFVIAPLVLAGFVPWWVTQWEFRPAFLGVDLTRILGVILIVVGVPGIVDSFARFALEGLGTPQKPSPVQQAFIDEQAAQCGYCINGMVMQTTAFLASRQGSPSEREIRQALQNNLCRCGTHQRIIAAVKRAAALMGKGA